MGAIAYVSIKYVAYALWCFLGLRLFQPWRASKMATAAWLGVLRSLMGLGFGIGIWLGGSMVYRALSHMPATSVLTYLLVMVYRALSHMPATSVLTYLLVYVPIRWLEWSIILVIVCPQCRSAHGFLLGLANPDRLWRVGGITLSCLSDIPMIISLGGILPVGRFMC